MIPPGSSDIRLLTATEFMEKTDPSMRKAGCVVWVRVEEGEPALHWSFCFSDEGTQRTWQWSPGRRLSVPWEWTWGVRKGLDRAG